jgi:hypothetical protein
MFFVDDEKQISVTASFAEGSLKGGRNQFVERPCGR